MGGGGTVSTFNSGEKSPTLQIKQFFSEYDMTPSLTENVNIPHNLNLPPMVKAYFQVGDGPIFGTPVGFHSDTGTDLYAILRGIQVFVSSTFAPTVEDPSFDVLNILIFNLSIDLTSSVKIWVFVYDVLAGSSG